MKLLHLIATPRGSASRTLRVSARFLAALREKHPGLTIDERNLFTDPAPSVTQQTVAGKYFLMGGKNIPPELQPVWKQVEEEISRFTTADAILVSTPMWNFSIPYVLKNYIDIVWQPGYLFRYTEKGPEGMVTGRKLAVISARGGDYGPDSPARGMDNIIPYLSTVFGFAGFRDIDFISVQPMDANDDAGREAAIAASISAAEKVAQGW